MCTVTNRAFGCRYWTMHAPMRPGWPPGAHLFHRLVHRLGESVRDWVIQQHRIFLTDAVSCCAAKKIERRRPAPTDRAARSPHASSSNLRCVWMSVWASLARIWRARLTYFSQVEDMQWLMSICLVCCIYSARLTKNVVWLLVLKWWNNFKKYF